MGIKRRHGPPTTPARIGQRFQIGVIVAGPTKKLIMESAKVSGRSISREAEHMIERCAAFHTILKHMRSSLEEMEKGGVEAVLVRLGYTPIRDAGTGKKAWAEPGYPGVQRSGFEAWKPGELEGHSEQAAVLRQVVGVTDEDVERSNREKLRRADEDPTSKKDDAA